MGTREVAGQPTFDSSTYPILEPRERDLADKGDQNR